MSKVLKMSKGNLLILIVLVTTDHVMKYRKLNKASILFTRLILIASKKSVKV